MSLETLPPIASACAVTALAMYPVDVARALKMASATGPGYTLGEVSECCFRSANCTFLS